MSVAHVRKCKSQNDVNHHSLRNEDFLYKLKHDFHDVFMSIYGPYGGAIFIQNSGGVDFFTSSSQIVLQQIRFDHPVSKLINAVINAQNKTFGTHGSYIGILSSELLYRCLKLDVPYRHFIDISSYLIQKIENKIEQSLWLSQKMNYSKASNILSFIKGVVDSKSCYSLSSKERTYFHCRVGECFIKSLPFATTRNEDFNPFHITTVEGPSTSQSTLITGLLYRETENMSRIKSVILNKCSSCNKIVLFNVPLAYIKDRPFNASCSVNSYNEFMIKRLKHILIDRGVFIIANQKYIDENIKYQLEKDGFLILERLGTSLMASLVKMSGGIPLSDFSEDSNIDDDKFGDIGNVKLIELFNKTYIHLNPTSNNSNFNSFIIAGINCHVTSYLESAARTCIDLLQLMVLKDSRVVFGGGCLEAFIVCVLMKIEIELSKQMCKEFDSSPLVVSHVLDAFIQVFVSLAVKPGQRYRNNLDDFFIDSNYGHLWRRNSDLSSVNSSDEYESYCVCRSIPRSFVDDNVHFTSIMSLRHESSHRILTGKKFTLDFMSKMEGYSWNIHSGSILDYFPAKLNAIRMALETFSELITVGDCYYNT